MKQLGITIADNIKILAVRVFVILVTIITIGFILVQCMTNVDAASSGTIMVGDKNILTDSDNIIEGDTGYVKWRSDYQWLIIDNYTYQGKGYEFKTGYFAGIYIVGGSNIDDITIMVKGDNNSIIVTGGETPDYRFGIIAQSIDLSFESYRIVSDERPSYISTLYVESGSAKKMSAGIYTSNRLDFGNWQSLVAFGDIKLTAKGGNVTTNSGSGSVNEKGSYGMALDKTIVTAGSNISGYGGQAPNLSIGVSVLNDFDVKNGGKIYGKGGYVSTVGDYIHSTGVYASNSYFQVTNGFVYGETEKSVSDTNGIYFDGWAAGARIINSSIVDGKAGESTQGDSCGVYLKYSGGMDRLKADLYEKSIIVAVGGKASSSKTSYGLRLNNSYIAVTGITIRAAGDKNSTNSIGIYSNMATSEESDNGLLNLHAGYNTAPNFIIAQGNTRGMNVRVRNSEHATGYCWTNYDGTGTASSCGSQNYYSTDLKCIVYVGDMNVRKVDYSGKYDEKYHTATIDCYWPKGYTIKYGLTEGTYDLDEIPTFKDVGNYKIYYKVTLSGLPEEKIITGSASVNIEKGDITIFAPETAPECPYDGLEHQLLLSGGSASAGRLIYYIDENKENSTDDWELVKTASAGYHWVYCEVVDYDETSYNKPLRTLVIACIQYADLSDVSVVYNEPTTPYVYDGKPKEINVTASATSINNQPITFQYSLDSSKYEPYYDNLEITDAGKKTIYYKASAPNHNDYFGYFTGFEIKKAESVISKNPEAKSLKYTGEAQELVFAGETNDGEIQYSLDQTSWSKAVPTGTSVGDYTVYYMVYGDYNHLDSEVYSINVSITEASKDELLAEINSAKSYYNTIVGDYPTIAENLNTAISSAEAVYNNSSATSIDIANAINALLGAMDVAKGDALDAFIDECLGAPSKVKYDNETKNNINKIKETYNDMTSAQKSYVDNMDKVYKAEEAYNVMDAINSIGNIKYDSESKGKIDNAKDLYNALNPDYQEIISNKDELDAALDLYNGVDGFVGKVNDIGNVSYTDTSKGKIDAAQEAYDALSEDGKAFIPEDVMDEFNQAKNTYNAMNLISNIGEVLYDDTSKGKIDAAREMYDSLDEDHKAMVGDLLDILEEAEREYKELDDIAKLDAVKELINNIGTVEYTQACKDRIDKARAAYDALANELKELVDNYQTLVNAEAIYDAMRLIDAIGEVKYTEYSKERIDDARLNYDSLTDTQKQAVTNYNDLTNAEEAFAQKVNDAGTDSKPEAKYERNDKDNEVYIQTKDKTYIPEDIDLKVEVKASVKAKELIKEYGNIKKLLNSNSKISKIYDVKLIRTVNGVEEEIQPSDIKDGMNVTIKITVPDNLKKFKLLHIHSEDDIEEIKDYVLNNGELEFDCNKLSEFVMVVPEDDHGFCIGWVVFIIAIVLLIYLTLYIFIYFGICNSLIKILRLDGLKNESKLLGIINVVICGVVLEFAFVSMMLHTCPITIVSFILITLATATFVTLFMMYLLKNINKTEEAI